MEFAANRLPILHNGHIHDRHDIRPEERGQNPRPDQSHDGEDAIAPFPQPFWELLLSFAVAFIPIAIVVWDHQTATTVELETQTPR